VLVADYNINERNHWIKNLVRYLQTWMRPHVVHARRGTALPNSEAGDSPMQALEFVTVSLADAKEVLGGTCTQIKAGVWNRTRVAPGREELAGSP